MAKAQDRADMTVRGFNHILAYIKKKRPDLTNNSQVAAEALRVFYKHLGGDLANQTSKNIDQKKLVSAQ